MDKLKMHSKDKTQENFEILQKLFPNAVTETITGYDEDGKAIVERAIDKDVLQQEINAAVVEGKDERYQFTWPDKKRAIVSANAPINKTLRPCREESVDFDNTENLYIEGDNLEVLKLLQETYLGKIKMIYIDPPYNTGHDFVYNDKFSVNADEWDEMSGELDEYGNRLTQNTESNGRFHTDWLNMIYPRLKIARDLLSDDGFIAISIGEEESYNLRKVCNNVFGEHNYRNILALRRYDKNLNLQFAAYGLQTMNVGLEYILIYSKNPFIKMMPVYRESSDERAQQGYWKGFWNNADRPTMRYEILGVIPEEGQWKWKKEVADEAVDNYIEYSANYSTKMSLEEYWESTGKEKRFIRRNPKGTGKNKGVEHWVAPASGILRNSNWSDMLISKPIGYNVPFDNPKNPDVIVELISLFGIDYGDIILDFFSGSATTAHAVIKQNFQDVFDGKKGKRKFIMVQLPEKTDEKSEAYKAGYKNICEIGKERIRRAGELEKKNIYATAGSSLKWNDERRAELGDAYVCPEDVDIGFRVLKLDSSNMKDVYYNPADFSKNLLDATIDNIKEDRTAEDLLFQVMLDLGVLLSSKIEETEIAGKKVFNVADGFLVACFDNDVNEEVITAVAKQQPLYFVMRDSSLSTDTTATNFDQIFETYSPDTIRKVI